MSSSDVLPTRVSPRRHPRRRGFLTLALLAPTVLATAGCGFHPLYGGGTGPGSTAARLQQVEIGNIVDRRGQQLRNLLIDRFYRDGRPDSPTYRVDVTLSASEQKLSIQKDSTATYAQLVVNAPYRLTDIKSGQIVLSGNARAFISYSVLEQHYAAVATTDNAYDQALLKISEDITGRVAGYLDRPPTVATAAPAKP